MNRFALITICVLIANISLPQNLFIRHMYIADPSARVFNDTLYVYPSHDENTATWFSMEDWHVLQKFLNNF